MDARKVGLLLLLLSGRATAQGMLRGKVLRDATRTPVAGAEVSIADSDQRATTDSAGAFAIDELPAGWTVVLIRKVGFTSRRDTVNIRGNGPTVREFLLSSIGQLDTVKTVAAETKYISPSLRAFEERRKTSAAGYFINDSTLRQADDKALSSIITQKVSGMHLIAGRMGQMFMLSSRKACKGPAFASCTAPNCYVTVYLDGVMYFSANQSVPPPDAAQIKVNELAGVEFYPAAGVAPAQYSATDSGCGVLLLWTRER